MTCGVYQIETRPGQVYIGSSRNIEARISRHFGWLHKGDHFNVKLQRSFNKSGGMGHVLLICREVDRLFYEQLCLDKLTPSLNLSPTAGYVDWHGRRHSEATKAKMRATALGRRHKETTLAKMRERRHTAETKAKMSAMRKGKPWSEARRAAVG